MRHFAPPGTITPLKCIKSNLIYLPNSRLGTSLLCSGMYSQLSGRQDCWPTPLYSIHTLYFEIGNETYFEYANNAFCDRIECKSWMVELSNTKMKGCYSYDLFRSLQNIVSCLAELYE